MPESSGATAYELSEGEPVELTLTGTVDSFNGLRLALAVDGGVVWLNGHLPAARIKRLAPVDWPPQAGDLWQDRNGSAWFIYHTHSKGGPILAARDSGGLFLDCGELEGTLLRRGPLTLLVRGGIGVRT